MHLSLAHTFWASHLRPTDHVIDATCGNGKDTAVLSQLVPQGTVYSLDIQPLALTRARQNAPYPNIIFLLQSHTLLPTSHPIRLIVYNLGYLPGGDKQLTTLTSTTLQSLHTAYALLPPSSALSVTCYPGHPEGALEQQAILAWSHTLLPTQADVRWTFSKPLAPSLLIVIKKFT